MMDIESHEIWTNLAQVMIYFGDHERALNICRTGTQINKDDWKIWKAFLFMSTYQKNIETMVYAYEKIVELKPDFIDEEALNLFVNELVRCKKANADLNIGKKIYSICQKSAEKFKRNSKVSALYAVASSCFLEPSNEMIRNITDSLFYSQNQILSKADWYRYESSVKTVISASIILADACLNSFELLSLPVIIFNHLWVAEKFLMNVLSKTRELFIDVLSGEVKGSLITDVKALESRIADIQYILKNKSI